MAGNNLITRLIFEAEDRASGVIGKIGAALVTWFAVDRISGFFSSAVGGAKDLEQQFSTLQAATDATGEEVAQLQAKAEELGASDKLAVSAKQAAEGMTELGRAGQSTGQILESITPVIALAQGAELELGKAAGIVTANLAGFNLEADQSGRVADVLAKAATSAKTTVAQLADALSYAAPAANAAGMSIEETTAVIAKMQNAGIDGSRAGTALNAMLSQLADPASTASKALDKAGISTRNFSEVLVQLEQGGPAAEAAIVGFGTEAGPALRALLAQGAQSVSDLNNKLVDASGSAEKAAATMNDNLAGAAEALGSVWEGLKTTLVQPLLEPIERQARSLAATLADFTKSAQMEQLKQVLVSTFETGAAQFKAFAGAIDWPAFAQSVSDTITSTLEALKSWGENVGTVKDTVVLAFSSIQTGVDTLKAGFFALAGAMATVVENVLLGFSKIVEGQSKLAFGPFKTMLQETSGELRALSESFATSAEVNFGKASDAIDEAGRHAETLRGAWSNLTAPADDVADRLARVGDEQQRLAQLTPAQSAALKELEAAQNAYNIALQQAQEGSEAAGLALVSLGVNVGAVQAKYDALTTSATEAAPAIAGTGEAAKDIRTPLEQASQQINALEIAYTALMSAGDVQGAARIRAQIEGLKDSIEGVGKQAGQSSEAVQSAFRALDVTSQAELEQLAASAKAAFETISADGTAAPEDVERAFIAYAEKAIAANDGVADSALRATAAMLGLQVTTSETGDQIVQQQQQISDANQRVSDSADDGADSNEKLADSMESVGGAADVMRKMVEEAIASLAQYSKGAAAAVDAIIQSYASWNDKVGQIRQLEPSDFISTDGLDAAKQELADLTAAADAAQASADAMRKSMTKAFDWWGPFYDGLSAIKELEAGLLRAEAAAKRLEIAAAELDGKLSDLADAFDAGDVGLTDYLAKLEQLRRQYSRLSDDDLDALEDKIRDVKDALKDQADTAVDGLNSWRVKLAGIYDQEVQIQQLNWQQDRLVAELALQEARRNGNAAEIAALQEQLRLIDEYYQYQLKVAAEQEAADAIAAADEAAAEAARLAGLSDEERKYEETLARLKARLAQAILDQDAVLQASILAQIEAEKARHQQVLADLEKETKAKQDAANDLGLTESSSATQSARAASAAVLPVRVVDVRVSMPSGDSGTVQVVEGSESTLEALLKSLEKSKLVA